MPEITQGQKIFDVVKLSFEGRDYEIAPENVLKTISRVEQVITLNELSRAMVSGNLPITKDRRGVRDRVARRWRDGRLQRLNRRQRLLLDLGCSFRLRTSGS